MNKRDAIAGAPDIPALALSWHIAGRGAAIATVIETWGSAPRQPGSQLVVDRDGAMEGSVSGGCVEGAVVTEAIEALQDGAARLLEFGVSDDDAFAAGLACGGRIRVLVEPVGGAMPVTILSELVAARANRRAVALVSDLTGPERRLEGPQEHAARFRLDRSGLTEDGLRFVAVHNPPLRIIIVGAVHIAQVLVGMLRACGHAPVVIDPRPAFAAPDRFPGENLIVDWPDEALAVLGLDARSAVITLAHDPRIDDPAILAALASDAVYLGCLGSRRTHAKRCERLRAAGITQAQIGRIRAPIGLPIGALGPAEIAVSIVAELTACLRQGQAEGACASTGAVVAPAMAGR